MVTFNSLYGATLFVSHLRHLFPPVWQHLVELGFRVQRAGSTVQNIRRMGENSDPILSRLLTKVQDPCTFQRPFPIVCFTFRSEVIRH